MLVASGNSDVIARLYDQAIPLINSGVLDWQVVASPATVAALREQGRAQDAQRVLRTFTGFIDKLPNTGLGGLQKRINLAQIAALSGRNEEALQHLNEVASRNVMALATIPAMSLRNSPYYRAFRDDPRLIAIDDRLRNAVNDARLKSGLRTISREGWISDQKTLLTKN